MAQEQNTIILKELGQTCCSVLLDEVKEKMNILKNCGMTEEEIISQLFCCHPLPQLIITRSYKLFLGDERKKVHLEPLVKSVYLLFLMHPEGIIFKDLPDYREELAHIYNKVRPWGLTERALRSIEDVTNPMLNSINEKCARIRKAFVTMLDSSVAGQYYIKGTRGKVKRITLPRDLVVWE
jgi:hypothetical protein